MEEAKNHWQRLEVMLELLVFGVVVGIAEDLVAVRLATGEPITWRIIGIVTAVAIPFAVLGEVFIDRIDFVKILKRVFRRE